MVQCFLGIALLQEALLVAFLGASFGIGAAIWIGELPLRFPLGAFRIDLDLPQRAIGLAAAMIAGFLGGLVPALRAVRVPLVDAIGGKV